ncbi:hypothetical protein POTOM_015577 [Populus tomentosa]|uniref:Uncharacterized protein n=1 Tax=Populus tomentosa TaxID=118781 RepID=A0A8X8A053_POPTO|nr:hypothetical protein POTOM_015577 [Populus tomentosa]
MKTSIIAFLLLHTVLLHPLIVARQLIEFDGKSGVRHEITNVEGNDGSNGRIGRGGVLPPPSPVPNCRANQLHC